VPVPEEVNRFLERGLGGEVIDVEAPIEQPALLAVDEANLRGGDDGVLEPGLDQIHLGIRCGVRHGSSCSPSGEANKTAFLYHIRQGGDKARSGSPAPRW
jgi:hypothetical protein